MVKVKGLRKSYSTDRGQVGAVRGVDFEVAAGEVFALLGPSGCGKTTTLRSIAGLEIPNEGEIWIQSRKVFCSETKTVVPVYRRGVGMVFQSYAIWPHMTVFENVAFPLVRGGFRVAKSEVKERVRRALHLVQMEGLSDRPAPLLSGGQQQRVALARALVYEPGVLLLDEPLSNLDAKLRHEMRLELRELVTRLKVTTVYVTHDQEEALVLADRVAVMQDGLLKQVGTPWELYLRPADDFVARFVGDVNLVPASVEEPGSSNGTIVVRSSFGLVKCKAHDPLPTSGKVTIMIRPEAVIVHNDSAGVTTNIFSGKVRRAIFVGSKFQCEIDVGDSVIRAEFPPWAEIKDGQHVSVEFPVSRLQILRQ
jgi:iron(III) transport system ATP-binding protein